MRTWRRMRLSAPALRCSSTDDLLERDRLLALACSPRRRMILQRRGIAALGRLAAQPAAEAAAERILAERAEHHLAVLVGRAAGPRSGSACRCSRPRRSSARAVISRAVVAERLRQEGIGRDAVNAGEDDQHHQHIGEGVDVPAELEAGVQGRDDDQRRGRDRRGPRSTPSATSGSRVIARLRMPSSGQPEDQQRADRAQRVAVPAAAVGPRLRRRSADRRGSRRRQSGGAILSQR